MTNLKTTIGIISVTYDCTFICTVAELYDIVHDRHCIYTAKQYCDFRYATNLQRFRYDPFTGEKMPKTDLHYIGSVQIANGLYVFHVFWA